MKPILVDFTMDMWHLLREHSTNTRSYATFGHVQREQAIDPP